MRLELLNKDVVVLVMEYNDRFHAVEEVVRLVAPEYAPPACVALDGAVSADDLSWWWRHRGIPASRPRLETLLESVGLDDALELVERAMGLSLSDRYWVRPSGSGLTWDEVNFFDNDFSDDLGKLTLDRGGGPGSGACSDDDLMSPNSTVLGNAPKKWVRAGGETLLLKAGVQAFDQDVRNEVVATQLYRRAMRAGDYVPYRIVADGDRELSCCANMLSEDQELVTAGDLLRRHRRDRGLGTYASVVAALSESGLPREYLEMRLSELFSLDYLIANFDRHLGNFGLIRDCATLKYVGFAPTYDSGNSLWCDKRSLERQSDYDYRPRPFLGRQGENPAAQLAIFVDYSWLEGVDLDDWAQEVVDTLSLCPNIPSARLAAIEVGVAARISHFERHVDGRARIYPALGPRRELDTNPRLPRCLEGGVSSPGRTHTDRDAR